MIVDGRAIAADIYKALENEVSHMQTRPHLTAFTCLPSFESKKYLNLKKRKAESVGIGLSIIEFPDSVSIDEMKMSLRHSFIQTDGVIVQLPFPSHIAADELLKEIPHSYDVDVMQYDGTDDLVLPPVVGGIAEIARVHDILFAAQKVVVVGHGKLVGAPAAIWAQKQGGQVSIVTEKTTDAKEQIANADILILGVGQPNLVTPDGIKEGVVIFDAGTSEMNGELRGDADPACAEKAALLTPVPGGIGPLTVAVLLRNLVTLASRAHQ